MPKSEQKKQADINSSTSKIQITSMEDKNIAIFQGVLSISFELTLK
jgi:hypothetical protein